MKLLIDSADSLTGWSISSPSTIALNEFKSRIAGLNEKSILVKFDADDTTRVLSKTFTAKDVTNYDTLIFSIASQNFGSRLTNKDFKYKVKINATTEFYIPVRDTLTDINIAIDDVTSMDRFEITALHSDNDYIWLSEILVEKENAILDLLNGVKEHIEYEIEKEISDGISIGTVTCLVGDSTVDGNLEYLGQYSVIKISDGVHEETHQIDDITDTGFTFLNVYDGQTIKYNYTDASIKLLIPVYINPDQTEIKLPGITVWGFSPSPVYRTAKLDRIYEAYNIDGSFVSRLEGQIISVPIQVDCESRQISLLDICAKCVRRWLENEITWVNGRFHETAWSDAPTEDMPIEGIDIMAKVQYNVNIETVEMFADRETLAPVQTTTVEVLNG